MAPAPLSEPDVSSALLDKLRLMPEPLAKRRLPWWPMPVCRVNESYSDEFYMSLASLALAYIGSICAYTAEWFYVQGGILFLYFAEIWLFNSVEVTSNRAEKWQIVAQQTIGGLLLTSPLLWMLHRNWP